MALKYKLETFINKITSPVVLEYNGEVQKFPNGAAAYEQDFAKYMIVDEVKIVGDKICIVLKENDRINDVTWFGEEQANFF
ncbi:MAG: hypothetical protein IJ746_07200 [Ruminococcus sp.]|nr:hypothetical protein [Ruminococcus sp.]